MIAAQEILGLSEGAFVAIMVALIGGPIVAWVTTRGAMREARAARQEVGEVRRSVGEQNGHGTVQDATGVILDRLDSMARAQHSMQTSLDAVVADAGLVSDRLKHHDREHQRHRRRLDDAEAALRRLLDDRGMT